MPASKAEQVLEAIKARSRRFRVRWSSATACCLRKSQPVTYGRPETSIEVVAGAPAIKNATLTVTVDYETGAPLS